MNKVLAILLFIAPLIGFGQGINVVPMPQEVVMKDGFLITNFGSFSGKGPESRKDSMTTVETSFACADCDLMYPFSKFVEDSLTSANFTFSGHILSLKILDRSEVSVIGAEGYHLKISPDTIAISANSLNGIHAALITVDQMYYHAEKADTSDKRTHYVYVGPQKRIPCCEITDYPAYSYRGMHLDVCRHFFSKDFIKRYIDQLAYYKINTLHWHLTDDQGWRIEIKKYPKLTEVGAWRMEKDGSKYGGYYTQEDIKEIIAYAQKRFITIIPEIEMPGHSSAALSAYPYLGCTGNQITVPNTWGIKKDIYAPTDTVFKFFEDVMDEVCVLFPGRYIHIGGDEAPKAQWKSSPIAQAVMKQNNLKDEEELQHYFMHRVEKYLNKKGKLAIGWGEVVKGGLSDSLVVMSWLSKGAGIKAAKHGNDVIMAPRGYCYFDYPQKGDVAKAFWMLPLPISKVYKFNPVPKSLNSVAAKHIMGGEATLWTEYVSTEAQAWHQLLPRLAAMSEALWTRPEKKDYADFQRRVNAGAGLSTR